MKRVLTAAGVAGFACSACVTGIGTTAATTTVSTTVAATTGTQATTTTVAATTATPATTTSAPATTTSAPATTPPATTAAESNAVGSRDNPVPIGQVADVGDGWTMKVNSVQLDATAVVVDADSINEQPVEGRQYVLANITIGYNGPDESSSSGVNILVIGQATNNPTNWYEKILIPPAPFLTSVGELFKGGENTGNLAFEIDSADAPTLELIGELLTGSGDRVFFATQ